MIISPLIRRQMLDITDKFIPNKLPPPLDRNQRFYFFNIETYVTNKTHPRGMYFLGHKNKTEYERQHILDLWLSDTGNLTCCQETKPLYINIKLFENYDVGGAND